jgi:hypothetical protein
MTWDQKDSDELHDVRVALFEISDHLQRIAVAMEQRNREADRHHIEVENALSRIERAAKR